MSDLISRSALIEAIINTPTKSYGHHPLYWDGIATRQNETLDIIDSLPTVEAIPKEKLDEIVEKMEELKEVFFYEVEADKYCKHIDDCSDKNCFVCIMDRAIDFVKGVINERD